MEQNETLTAAAYAIVRCHGLSEKSAEVTWQAIGNYGDAGRFVGFASVLEAGIGAIGSIRRIGDSILEAKVGETARSYTYAQTQGPMAPYDYHGCLAVEPVDANISQIHYTLVFDASRMEDGQMEKEIARLSERFQGVVDAMCVHVRG
jgi:hypothetical protein